MTEPWSPTGATAVVVDPWPLVQLGIAGACEATGVRVVGLAVDPSEGVAMMRAEAATVLLIGGAAASPDPIRLVKEIPSDPDVVVLVDRLRRAQLVALLGAGADALLMRSVGPAELSSAMARIANGDRVIDSGLFSALGGVEPIFTDAAEEGVSFTERERELLRRLADGLPNDRIAAAMYLSVSSIKTLLSQLYVKLAVSSRHEALARAVALGVLD